MWTKGRLNEKGEQRKGEKRVRGREKGWKRKMGRIAYRWRVKERNDRRRNKLKRNKEREKQRR